MPQTAYGTRRLYRPLLRYLEQLPAGQTTSELTLAQLHSMLGPPIAPEGLPNWNLARLTTTIKQHAGFTAQHNRLARSITVQRLPGVGSGTPAHRTLARELVTTAPLPVQVGQLAHQRRRAAEAAP